MNIHFTFRNVDSSEGVKNYATTKIERLQKFVRSPLDADVTLTLEKHTHGVDVTLRAGGDRWAGRAETEDMYASIDLVMDKLHRQMRDTHAVQTDRKRHGGGVAQLSGKFGPPPGSSDE